MAFRRYTGPPAVFYISDDRTDSGPSSPPQLHMTEPATRTPDPDERPSGPAGRPSALPRTSPTLRVAGTIPADVDHMELRRDVRARRPSVVSALVHARAFERGARIVSLLALDFAALLGAIFTALAVKELIRGDFVFNEVDAHGARLPAVRVPRHRAAVRAQRPLQPARGTPGLYGDRRRPVPGGVRGAGCSRS